MRWAGGVERLRFRSRDCSTRSAPRFIWPPMRSGLTTSTTSSPKSSTYLALLRAALYYMKVETIDLLVVGLPVAAFLARKAALERLACGEHDLGRGRKVVVKKAVAVAQPQGALVHYAASTGRLHELQDEQSLVIDVGARTFDWLATRGLRLVSKKCHSVNRGVFDVLQALAQQISMDIGAEYRDLDAIDAAIRKRKPLSICQHPYPLDKLERSALVSPSRRSRPCSSRWAI